MKKLLLPLIILLLIIGYFMSRGGDHKAKDAYDSLDKPETEQHMEGTTPPDSTTPPGSTTPPPDSETPPNGMGTEMPQESDRPDSVSPGERSDSSLMDKAEGAAKDVGEAVGDAAEEAGRAVKDAGEATKKAAEDAAEKLRREHSDSDKSSDSDDESQN